MLTEGHGHGDVGLFVDSFILRFVISGYVHSAVSTEFLLYAKVLAKTVGTETYMRDTSVYKNHQAGPSCLNSFIQGMLLLLLSRFSCVQLCATPETTAHQAPPSLGFSRQEHWSGLPFPSPMRESEK